MYEALAIKIVIYYCLIALSTGISAYLTLYRPVIVKLRSTGNYAPRKTFIFFMVVVVVCALTAPFVFIQMLKGLDAELEANITRILLGQQK